MLAISYGLHDAQHASSKRAFYRAVMTVSTRYDYLLFGSVRLFCFCKQAAKPSNLEKSGGPALLSALTVSSEQTRDVFPARRYT